jgi:hypothetical protein
LKRRAARAGGKAQDGHPEEQDERAGEAGEGIGRAIEIRGGCDCGDREEVDAGLELLAARSRAVAPRIDHDRTAPGGADGRAGAALRLHEDGRERR